MAVTVGLSLTIMVDLCPLLLPILVHARSRGQS
ncbi:hypothetical protein LINPERHAP2_LOCUS27555 [Linum perenne]